jgi:uncharacterized membrane protein
MNENTAAAQAAGVAEVQRWVLVPHRSLGPSGFLVLMGLLCAVSFVSGAVFAAMGAWPVAGFFGLDVLLIWAAFKLNYRSARQSEIVEISRDTLTVTRVQPSGRQRAFTFNPYWARLHLDEETDGRTRLYVKMRDREVTIGRLLSDDERRTLAHSLSAALAEARLARF